MAQEGLEAARRYAKIAPAAPHALHMPSHIFTRLGLWQEDIDSNLASKAAAEKAHTGAENRLHAMEFLEYAYLQIGRDEEAQAIIAEAKTIPQSAIDPRYGNYYAIVQARFPTMFAIETGDWQAAAHAQTIVGDDGWGRGLTLLAHAVAAGHLRDRALANATLQATGVFMKQQMKGRPLPRSGTAEAGFLDEVHAWTDFANGDLAGAITLLQPIADRQDKLGKGELDLPVREMMAEMLLIDGKPDEALNEYQASLASDPNRFNGLLGAGRAAERLDSGIWRRSTTAHCWRIAVARTAKHRWPSAILGRSFARWQTALVLETQVQARVSRQFVDRSRIGLALSTPAFADGAIVGTAGVASVPIEIVNKLPVLSIAVGDQKIPVSFDLGGGTLS